MGIKFTPDQEAEIIKHVAMLIELLNELRKNWQAPGRRKPPRLKIIKDNDMSADWREHKQERADKRHQNLVASTKILADAEIEFESKDNGRHIITTRKGEEIIVDDSDYEWLSKFTWHINSDGYARRYLRVDGKDTKIRMHREIMNAPAGYEVDHINGNKLDNRRCNLRVCTHAENTRNVKMHSDNKTGVKGVRKSDRKSKPFASFICIDGKQIRLGRFFTAEEAHQSYIAASLQYHGAFSPYATGRQEE